MMFMRSLVGGALIIIGCTTITLVTTAIFMSMQLEAGRGLIIGLVGLAGGVSAVVVGGTVVLFRR